jgi:hypothetical protein
MRLAADTTASNDAATMLVLMPAPKSFRRMLTSYSLSPRNALGAVSDRQDKQRNANVTAKRIDKRRSAAGTVIVFSTPLSRSLPRQHTDSASRMRVGVMIGFRPRVRLIDELHGTGHRCASTALHAFGVGDRLDVG